MTDALLLGGPLDGTVYPVPGLEGMRLGKAGILTEDGTTEVTYRNSFEYDEQGRLPRAVEMEAWLDEATARTADRS